MYRKARGAREGAHMLRRDMLKSGAAMAAIAGCGREATPSGPADLADLDATGLAKAIRDKRLTAVEAVEAAGRRIEALNGGLGAFTAFDVDRAIDRARSLDLSAPLAGVPYAIKDLDDYPGFPFRRGSALFRDAAGQSKVPYTEQIDAAGVVVLGKTATPEFGLLPSTEPLSGRTCLNPWNVEHSCGGSSGGAAAAVAARILPAAHASDGGGSIRIPASCCGVFGLKPTRGRFPDQGIVGRTIAISIKHAVSVSVRDSALLLALGERRDGPLPPVGFVTPEKVAPLKIAMSLEGPSGAAPHADVARAVREAAALLQSLGAEIVPVEATPLKKPGAQDAFGLLWGEGAEMVRQLAIQMTGKPPEETGALEPWTLGLAEAYRAAGPEAFAAAVALLLELTADVAQWFETYDAWLTPVLAAPPMKLGLLKGDVPFATLSERCNSYVAYTPIHNVAGTPAASIPFAWTDDGLPIGVQLSAAIGAEALLLNLAYAIEEARPWADKLPPAAA
jgi:amidase